MRAFKSSQVSRLAVDGETSVRALGSGEEIASDVDTGLCGFLRAPDAGHLLLGLHSPPVVEEALVDGQLDPRGSQRVADRRAGSLVGTVAASMSRPRATRSTCSTAAVWTSTPLRRISSAPNSSVGRTSSPMPSPSTRVASMELIATIAPIADLRIDEGIRDRERHLVAELGNPHGVADDQKVHGRRSYPAAG